VPNRFVIKSVKGLINRKTAWRLQNQYNEGRISRMRLLHESGIAQMLVQLQRFSRLLLILRLAGNEEATKNKLDEDKHIILKPTPSRSLEPR